MRLCVDWGRKAGRSGSGGGVGLIGVGDIIVEHVSAIDGLLLIIC